ncbi:hypothetical protein G4V62_03435 [Bacillaceae bacterium SIJ1]|uniref:hypothetical protein n=1 Tax=Litoribacterium kuwaitense TaxID=1398745 RepID=UPI0013ECEFE3|nr:hypothetical protein [Litoribacterium kuwaitense]NGP44047.1 hypothetical protein [Litoribacterium kuwaitense]
MQHESKKPVTQAERDHAWQVKNRERANYLHRRLTARHFLMNDATLSDLNELKGLLKKRELKFKK